MALTIESNNIDAIDSRILQEMQADARISMSELGRRIHLSQPAVKERVRRLMDLGVIRGFHADLDMTRLGYAIRAVVRVTATGNEDRRWLEILDEIDEVVECYSVTGEDSFVVKVIAKSVEHLDQVIERLSAIGKPTTSIILQEIERPMKLTTE
ncbi:MAG TPA: Lrp/AsnC family transcriptional regulator [Thermoflexales bacterium]|nr:Lrp/AsnC family transcriptional regulator [Thermoflexales bacterium]HQW36885.1 Lrp/AsnC family transcriptional regulator [Thermoflexales bacterium]HQX75241.1 Lrp/AsnC family transcriptional regulator [Thermoflexales bacterium]HQZ22742.1 Lrp/AsnC family transcriptional regulator [Thermoflexales bacterium]